MKTYPLADGVETVQSLGPRGVRNASLWFMQYRSHSSKLYSARFRHLAYHTEKEVKMGGLRHETTGAGHRIGVK